MSFSVLRHRAEMRGQTLWDVERSISQPFLRLYLTEWYSSVRRDNLSNFNILPPVEKWSHSLIILIILFLDLQTTALKFQHWSITLEKFLRAQFMNIRLVILHYTKTSALNWDKTKELAQQCEPSRVNQALTWTTNDQELINWVSLWAFGSNRGISILDGCSPGFI